MTSPAPFKYRKLIGYKGGFSRSSLYVGDDHFLMVTNQHFSEDYRRFYFNEIEGITARKTTRGRNLTIVFSILLAITGIPVVFAGNEGAFVLGFLAVSFLVLLVANLILGPTVECIIRTTASQEIIPMVSRLGRYRKFLAKARPHIESSQGGTLDQQQVIARFGTNRQPLGTP